MRTIDAGLLTLLPQTRDHAEEMFAVLGDPAIYTYENEPPPSLEWLRARFEKLESRQSADGAQQWLNWVIRLAGNGLIGYVQATVHRDGSAAIAYEMESAHWGRGLGRRATEAMLRELIDHYHVTAIFAVAKAGNFRSLGLLSRLGFAIGGPELRVTRGALVDETLMFRNVVQERL
jgi:[ribosomal protein S5]-alanine N-acetyltransferase